MKKNYVKEACWNAEGPGDFYYSHKNSGYHRPVRTFPELRRNYGDWNDFRWEKVKGLRRRRNSNLLNAWNDFNRSRDYKKSWKDFTKHAKQWMVAGDPAPVGFTPSPLALSIARDFGIDLDLL